MSKSINLNRQKESNLKAGVKDLVGPLLKQLKEVEDLKDPATRFDIKRMREKMKYFVESREYWDSELISCFEKIERQIDYSKENQGEDNGHTSSIKEECSNQQISSNNNESTEGAWRVLMKNLNELLDKQKVDPKTHEESSKSYEFDEPSNNSNQVELFDKHKVDPKDLIQTSKSCEFNEPSNNSNQTDDNSVKFEECIKEFDPIQRDCLYILGIFPENGKIKKRFIIYWWIGLGLVPSENNANTKTEQLAETFFSHLVEKGIIQPVHIRKHNRTINWCTIKPTIHKQLIYACESRGLPIKIDSEEGTLHFYRDERSNARGLLNLDLMYLNSEYITKNVFSGNHGLQVVQFGKWHCTEPELCNVIVETKFKDHIEVDETEFLKKLGEKVTFLSLQGISLVEELPKSIGKLEDLRILDLRSCHNLEKLPQKRWSQSHKILRSLLRQQKWFKNLTYIDMSECYLLYHMPRWVCELSELEVLKGFVAGNEGKKNQFCRLRDLSKLKKLRKLSIKIVKQLDPEDLSGLKSLENLSVLTIIWGIKDQFEESDAEQQSSYFMRVATNDKLANVGKQRINGKDSLKVCGSLSEQIRTQEAENESTDNTQGGFTTSEGGIVGENKAQAISFPKNLEKLDIRKYSKAEAPELLNPDELQNLKRLYIRGGKLAKIGQKLGWNIEILRLRYLNYLNLNWYHLSKVFPKLKSVEYEQCFDLRRFPREKSYWETQTDGPFPSASDEPNEILIFDRRVQLAVTRNKMTPPASHKQKMVLELTGGNFISSQPGLDLVAVLNVNTLTDGRNLEIWKTAMQFVIKKLSSMDRLSIVIFSDKVTTVYPLRHLTETSRKEAETLVVNLKASDTVESNTIGALRMGLRIIKDSSNSSGRVACIMLCSNNDDDRVAHFPIDDNVTVHTFRFHGTPGAKELMDIAYNSMGGTFSFITNKSSDCLTKAFAVCLAGLLTVVVQDLTLTIRPIKEESTLEQVYAGRYRQSKDEADGSVTVKFGDLYISEVRKILMDIGLPATDKGRDSKVLEISCSYKVNEKLFELKPAILTISRMAEMSTYQYQVPPQVIAEAYRLEIVEIVREAASESLENDIRFWSKIIKAQNILEDLIKKKLESNALFELMLNEIRELLSEQPKPEYEWVNHFLACRGRYFAYSILTSHDRQRTAVRCVKAENSLIFSTPAMVKFLEEAEKFHTEQPKN